MNSIKGTETEKNLLKSFAGESQARMRYNYFAYKAKEEGFPVISSIFEETANHEREHAKRFFKFLEGGMLNIEASFPAGKIGTTAENLLASINGEHEEASSMYPEFAKKAREEGLSLMTNHTELAELGIYTGNVSFEYSPPGASNLPVHIVLMPVE